MKALRALGARLRALADGPRRDRDLDDELESHLALHIDDNLRAGMSPDEARRHALARLGSANGVREAHREQRRFGGVDNLVRDARHGVRLLRRNPLFTLVAVLSLGLGIGANAAVFTIANALTFRTLPVDEPEHLALLANESWTYPILEELQRHRHHFGGVAGWADGGRLVRIDGRGSSELENVHFVSGGFFETLGVSPQFGRTISTDDDRRGAGPDGPVALVSHAYWERRFNADPNVLSRTLAIEGVSFSIIGVMPGGYFGPEVGRTFDVAIPFGTEPLIRGAGSMLDGRSMWWLNVFIRRAPGQSLEAAQQVLRSLQPQVREATIPGHFSSEHQEQYLRDPFTLEAMGNGRSTLRSRYERPLAILAMAAALVLLVTCANMANLLLARANTRRPEMSMRLALGASRARLIRQLMAEGVTLSAGGALAGLALAWFSSRLIVSLISTSDAPVHLDLGLDWHVLAFTAAVAILTALLFSVVPAVRATSVSPHDAVKEQSRSVAGEGRLFTTHALMVTQVALSLALVVIAGLLVRTFTGLSSQPLGFEPGPVLVASVTLARDGIVPDARAAFYAQVLQTAESLPGIASAASSLFVPIKGSGWNTAVRAVDGSDLSGTGRERLAWVNGVSPGFFKTYGTPMRAGRAFLPTDAAGAPAVAIVNDAFVARYMSGADPIGRQFTHGGPTEPPLQIVGRVADARYVRDLRQPMAPTIYLPLSQLPDVGGSLNVSVRAAAGNPAALERTLVAALENVGPVSVRARPLEQFVRNALVQERLVATVAGFFGGLALLIAGIGLYGVTAYSVSRRRAELGIRLTLGAPPAGIVSMVFMRVALLVGIGVVAGTGLALWLATFVRTLLYNLEPSDPVTMASAAAALVVTGGLAALVPAWRAARTDPATVLREQ